MYFTGNKTSWLSVVDKITTARVILTACHGSTHDVGIVEGTSDLNRLGEEGPE